MNGRLRTPPVAGNVEGTRISGSLRHERLRRPQRSELREREVFELLSFDPETCASIEMVSSSVAPLGRSVPAVSLSSTAESAFAPEAFFASGVDFAPSADGAKSTPDAKNASGANADSAVEDKDTAGTDLPNGATDEDTISIDAQVSGSKDNNSKTSRSRNSLR